MISNLSSIINSYSHQSIQQRPYAPSSSVQETKEADEQQDTVTISQDAKNLSNGAGGIQLKGYYALDMLTAEEKAAFSTMKKQGNLSEDEINKIINALAMDRSAAMTADSRLETNYSLDLEGHFHLTGVAVPSLDTNYITKLMRESHINNTMASGISQKSLSVALNYLSQNPIG